MAFYHNVVRVGFSSPLVRATFRRRLSRFSVIVEIDATPVTAHLPNSGRLGELLVDGAAAWLVAQPGPIRRTAWDLALVEYEGRLVSVDARLPNALIGKALAAGCVDGREDVTYVRREVAVGGSRLDFAIECPSGRCFVEVKSVTLVADGCGRFPDAPTTRGARHLGELAKLRAEGHAAMVIFVVQRADATAFTVNAAADPPFAAALYLAAVAGVEIQAYRCSVTLEGIELLGRVPVLLD